METPGTRATSSPTYPRQARVSRLLQAVSALRISTLHRTGWLAATIAGIAALPLVVCLWVGLETHNEALRDATAEQQRITNVLAEHTLRLFDSQAMALDFIDQLAGEADCPALRADPALPHFLRLATRESTAALWLINADGFLCTASDASHMDNINRAFRDYFQGTRDAGAGHYYVGRAIVGLSDHSVVFNVAKPRIKAGTFNGLLLTSINLADLIDYWNKVINAAPTQRIAVFRSDGQTIARSWPPFAPAPDLATERRVAGRWQTQAHGAVIGKSLQDNSDRVGAWFTVPGWPVVATSSIETREVLRPWRASMLIYTALATVTSGVLAIFGLSLLRKQRQLARTIEQRTCALRISEERANALSLSEALLRENEERFRMMIQGVQDYAIFMLSPDGTVASWNSGATRLTGWQESEIIGQHFSVFLPNGLSNPGPAQQELEIATNAGDYYEETVRIRKDGSRFWAEIALAALHDKNGTLRGYTKVIRDITERKRAQEEQSMLLRELEQRETEMREARDRAERASRAKTEFLNMVSHELRTPLTQLGLQLELHDRTFRNALTDVQAKVLARTAAAFRRLCDLVNSVLDYSRIASGRLETSLRDFDVCALVREACDNCAEQARQRGLLLTFNGVEGLPLLHSDPGLIRHIVHNLLDNAIKYTITGTVSARVSCANDAVYIEVADTGLGISAEFQAKVFEPFEQAEQVDRKHTPGVGLGLALTKEMTEVLGGDISLVSELGKGSVFVVRIPLTGAPQHDRESDDMTVSLAT